MELAILNEEGALGLALHTAKCFQEGRLDQLKLEALAQHHLDVPTMDSLYKESLQESDAQVSQL